MDKLYADGTKVTPSEDTLDEYWKYFTRDKVYIVVNPQKVYADNPNDGSLAASYINFDLAYDVTLNDLYEGAI